MAGSACTVEREPRIWPKYTRPFSSREVGSGNDTIAMVEKGTTQENVALSAGGMVHSHPMLAPMTSTSSLQYLVDDDKRAAGSAQ